MVPKCVPASEGNNGKLITQSTGPMHDLSQWIKPDWQHPAGYKRLGKNVIEMPIDPGAKFSSALKKCTTTAAVQAAGTAADYTTSKRRVD